MIIWPYLVDWQKRPFPIKWTNIVIGIWLFITLLTKPAKQARTINSTLLYMDQKQELPHDEDSILPMDTVSPGGWQRLSRWTADPQYQRHSCIFEEGAPVPGNEQSCRRGCCLSQVQDQGRNSSSTSISTVAEDSLERSNAELINAADAINPTPLVWSMTREDVQLTKHDFLVQMIKQYGQFNIDLFMKEVKKDHDKGYLASCQYRNVMKVFLSRDWELKFKKAKQFVLMEEHHIIFQVLFQYMLNRFNHPCSWTWILRYSVLMVGTTNSSSVMGDWHMP